MPRILEKATLQCDKITTNNYIGLTLSMNIVTEFSSDTYRFIFEDIYIKNRFIYEKLIPKRDKEEFNICRATKQCQVVK